MRALPKLTFRFHFAHPRQVFRQPPISVLRRDETVPTCFAEVFAVTVLGRRFPELLNDDQTLLESSFVVPAECLGDVAATVRAQAST
jgi:hypothetical protein